MTKDFKLSHKVFPDTLTYLKYKFGFIKYTKTQTLNLVLNHLHRHNELENVEVAVSYEFDLPKFKLVQTVKNKNDLIAGGSDFENQEVATSKFIGEYLERYEFLIAKYKPSFREIEVKSLVNDFGVKLHDDYHKKTNKQLERHKELAFTENDKLLCVLAKELVGGGRVVYPAQAFFYLRDFFTKEKHIFERNSSGAAAGFDVWMARLGALYELIERDSFFVHWLPKISPREIIIDDQFNERVVSKYNYLKKYKLRIRFFDITSDLGVPVVLAVNEDLTDPKKGYILSMSSASTYEKSIEKALLEAFQSISFFGHKYEWSEYDFQKEDAFLDENLLTHNRITLTYGKNKKEMDFIMNTDKKVNASLLGGTVYKNDKEEFNSLVAKLKAKIPDLTIYEYSSINPVLNEIGFVVLKLVCPQLFPMYLVEYRATPLSERVHKFREFVGEKTEYVPNPYPHPFS